MTSAAKCKLAPKSPVLCDQQATGKSHSNGSLQRQPGCCLGVGEQNAAIPALGRLFLSLPLPEPGQLCWSQSHLCSPAGFAGHKRGCLDHELPGNKVLHAMGDLLKLILSYPSLDGAARQNPVPEVFGCCIWCHFLYTWTSLLLKSCFSPPATSLSPSLHWFLSAHFLSRFSAVSDTCWTVNPFWPWPWL